MAQSSSPKPIGIIIAVSLQLFRYGIKHALAGTRFLPNTPRISCTGEAHNRESLMGLLVTQKPDVILLDQDMSGTVGTLALIAGIKKDHPETRVIVLCANHDEKNINDLICGQADSCIAQDSNIDAICDDILGVTKEVNYINRFVSGAFAQKIRQNRRTPEPILATELTEKETAILRYMCEEKSTKEIASLVKLSHRTVEAIRYKMQDKTGTKTTIGLVMYALKNNIVEA